MFGHLPEFFIILVIGLIVFGPERLPEVAANAGKMVREVRQALDVGLNPQDVEVPTDFSTYYYESMARSGEELPEDDIDEEPSGEYAESGSHPVAEDDLAGGDARGAAGQDSGEYGAV